MLRSTLLFLSVLGPTFSTFGYAQDKAIYKDKASDSRIVVGVRASDLLRTAAAGPPISPEENREIEIPIHGNAELTEQQTRSSWEGCRLGWLGFRRSLAPNRARTDM